MVQQLGHCWRASKLAGRAAISAAESARLGVMPFLAALAAALERGFTPMRRLASRSVAPCRKSFCCVEARHVLVASLLIALTSAASIAGVSSSSSSVTLALCTRTASAAEMMRAKTNIVECNVFMRGGESA